MDVCAFVFKFGKTAVVIESTFSPFAFYGGKDRSDTIEKRLVRFYGQVPSMDFEKGAG